ncbi:protein translocase subunit SecE [Marinobacterium nitratireducens]|uniref:Protein translocase subunit SecE n=1 Tax=Marinobacterium nitratireducens TaxID=518897 RepID=A0A917ZRC8_9GAMM|nr:preprotein translocase subunit SecE [Marinobacterium nitratireducens]GGO89492.1 protein translocase subunit SecE [Marinobacterium nitratireducens]
MNSKAVPEESKFDGLKWLVVVLIVAAGVVGNSIYSEQSLFYRVVALVVLALAAGFVALTTAKGKAFFNLFKEAKTEIRKVVWPTRQETLQTTLMVVVVVLIVGLLLWGLDSLLGWIVSSVIG